MKGDIYKTPKYYNEGPRKLSILHTRLRYQCSSLNADLSRIHMINNYKCNFGASFEDAIHYFLECPKWTKDEHFLVIATISTSILKHYSLGTMIIVMKYLEMFELLKINLKDFMAKSAIFHLYFLLSSYRCQNSKYLLLKNKIHK